MKSFVVRTAQDYTAL